LAWADRRSALVGSATTALVCLPIAADLLGSDRRRPFGYVAADFFYYAVVAENMAASGVPSYDGERATNGFHPLWQLILAAARALTKLFGADRDVMLPVSVWLCLVLMVGGVILLLAAWRQAGRGVPAVFVVLPVGIYSLVLSPLWWAWDSRMAARYAHGEGAMPLNGTLWSYVNGMESALVILAYGAVSYWYVARPVWSDRRRAAVFGGLLSVLTLARLDHGLIAGVLFGVAALRARPRLAHAGVVCVGAAAFAVPVLAYLGWNQANFGSPVPMSGRIKSTFPELALDVTNLVQTAQRLAPIELVYRYAQLLLPLAVAVVCVIAAVRAGHRRAPEQAHRDLLIATAVGTILLCSYNLLFVGIAEQGHWYVPVPTLFVSLAVFHAVGDQRWLAWLEASPRRTCLLLVGSMAVCAVYFVGLHRQPDYHRRYASFYFDHAPRLVQFYRERGAEPRLFEADDGIVAFATGYPALSGTGLALDREGYDYYLRGKLGDLALARGHDRLTSLYYFNFTRFVPEQADRLIERFQISPAPGLEARLEYSDPGAGVGVVRVDRDGVGGDRRARPFDEGG
jgi:hypothetical protein